jgi:hypothetical protein
MVLAHGELNLDIPDHRKTTNCLDSANFSLGGPPHHMLFDKYNGTTAGIYIPNRYHSDVGEIKNKTMSLLKACYPSLLTLRSNLSAQLKTLEAPKTAVQAQANRCATQTIGATIDVIPQYWWAGDRKCRELITHIPGYDEVGKRHGKSNWRNARSVTRIPV